MESAVQRPKICLCLTGKTLDEDLAILNKYRSWIDIAELRVDYLASDERLFVRKFPELAGIPCILTIRRRIDGGQYYEGEASRTTLFARALAFADQDSRKNFAYIDLESDYHVPSLQDAALAFGTRVIRSYHNMNAPVRNLSEMIESMRTTGYEIPKVACMARTLSDVTQIFAQTKDMNDSERIITVMGPYGLPSRILSAKLGSCVTYTTAPEQLENMKAIGHIDPVTLQETYNFRAIDANTELYGITGYPLEVTDSPAIHNKGYREHGMNAVYIPIKAQRIEEAIEFANVAGVKGMSVTIPFKEKILPDMNQLSAEVGEIGACNTAIRRNDEWIGYNTDAIGLKRALCSFLITNNLARRKVAIIGAGGAARAAAYVVKQLRGKACIFNRSLPKAKKLAEHYGFKYAELSPENADLLETYSDLIIQTTPVGMGAVKKERTAEDEVVNSMFDVAKEPVADAERDPLYFYTFKGHECVYDIIYNPERTPMLERAEEAGCHVENGFSMLRNQAYRQFSLFTGVEYE